WHAEHLVEHVRRLVVYGHRIELLAERHYEAGLPNCVCALYQYGPRTHVLEGLQIAAIDIEEPVLCEESLDRAYVDIDAVIGLEFLLELDQLGLHLRALELILVWKA